MLACVLETIAVKVVTGLGVNGVATACALDDPHGRFRDGVALVNVRSTGCELDAVFDAPWLKWFADEGVVSANGLQFDARLSLPSLYLEEKSGAGGGFNGARSAYVGLGVGEDKRRFYPPHSGLLEFAGSVDGEVSTGLGPLFEHGGGMSLALVGALHIGVDAGWAFPVISPILDGAAQGSMFEIWVRVDDAGHPSGAWVAVRRVK